MEIFGIGTSELIFILLIAIIVLGPKDMQKAGKTVGRWLNQLMKSDGWRAFQRASKEIRNLPTSLMREANLEELREMDKEIRNNIDPHPPRAPVSARNPAEPPSNQAASTPRSPSPEPQAPVTARSDTPSQTDGNDPDQK